MDFRTKTSEIKLIYETQNNKEQEHSQTNPPRTEIRDENKDWGLPKGERKQLRTRTNELKLPNLCDWI